MKANQAQQRTLDTSMILRSRKEIPNKNSRGKEVYLGKTKDVHLGKNKVPFGKALLE